MASTLRMITRWPFTTWWLIGVLNGVAWYVGSVYLDLAYDDNGIGSVLLFASYITTIPIQLAAKLIEISRDATRITGSELIMAGILAGVFCVALDRLLHMVLVKAGRR